ncbi:MAG: J domain-containing protein [Nitrospirota bacterium]
MSYAAIWIEDGLIYLIAPYNELFLNELKLAIPKAYKQWDQEGRVWLIHEKYLSALIGIAFKYFKVKSMQQQQQNTSYKRLLCNLNKQGLKAVWRQVALRLHPDTGGSHYAFIEAQQAYKQLIDCTGAWQ